MRPSTALAFGLRKYDVHRHGEGIGLEKSVGGDHPCQYEMTTTTSLTMTLVT